VDRAKAGFLSPGLKVRIPREVSLLITPDNLKCRKITANAAIKPKSCSQVKWIVGTIHINKGHRIALENAFGDISVLEPMTFFQLPTNLVDGPRGCVVPESQDDELWAFEVEEQADGKCERRSVPSLGDAHDMALMLDNISQNLSVGLIHWGRPFEVRQHRIKFIDVVGAGFPVCLIHRARVNIVLDRVPAAETVVVRVASIPLRIARKKTPRYY
jgi:hypothetical protein